jgi:YHS domain-containing protein
MPPMKLVNFALVLVAIAAAAVTFDEVSAGEKVAPINADKRGVALHGYDPVTYIEKQAPEKGAEQFSYNWQGATWMFVSAENRKNFAKSPESFAPQFGGYCAKAVSENHIADVDPLAYKIVNGKLYLNYDAKVQKVWEQDIPGRIANAEKYWPNLH